ncbi:DivIVA domain-containing protein [Rhabdothermincola salaria]|uniref:DivIVA domain-containing protein n=1 Tax=Rhabdothermincola salaria TaxID=2903142 RepID=UPI001E4FA7D7|nr:DivIVA domain-containing protein [Rhabdothermincola salaria]
MAQDSSAPIDPDDIIKQSFTTVRRGLDPLEVQRYLLDLANQMRAARERERALEGQLRDAEKRATPIDQLDPSRLTALLGEETARVLDAARAAASEIRAKAEENVARLLREARDEAQRMRADAESILVERTEEAEAEVARIRATADGVKEQAELDADSLRSAAAALRDEAEAEAASLRDEVAAEIAAQREAVEAEVAERRERGEEDAAELTEAGRLEGREMVAEAQRVRQRMLDDLARRRKLLRQQIEQLQAGRDRLLSAYDVVRQTLDVATEELHVALPEAKLAAETASLQATEDDVAFAAEVEAASREEAVGDEGEQPPVGDDAGAERQDQDADATVAADAEASDADDAGGGDVPVGGLDDESGTDDVEHAPVGSDEAPDDAEGTSGDGEATIAEEPAPPVDVDDGDEPSDTDESSAADGGRRAPDPSEGRHSTSVRVVRSERAERTAAVFAQVRDDEEEAPGAAVLTHPGETSAGPGAGEATEGPEGSAGDEDERREVHPLIEARDLAVAELERNLSRRLKRDLSDEQNELLDAVRQVKGSPAAETVLSAPDVQVERYRDLARPLLADAAEAGAELAGSEGGGEVATDVDELAGDLAMELALPLRERLERCFAEAEGDPDELAERIRACYREWKSQRVDGPASAAVVAAADRGLLDALADGTPVRWVVDDGRTASPDCEDNALAEGVVKGEPFPTGHVAPPVHPSCRCLVVPVSAH